MFEWNKNELQRTWTTFTLSIVVAVIVCFLDITTHRKCFGHSFATYWSSDSILCIDLKLFSNAHCGIKLSDGAVTEGQLGPRRVDKKAYVVLFFWVLAIYIQRQLKKKLFLISLLARCWFEEAIWDLPTLSLSLLLAASHCYKSPPSVVDDCWAIRMPVRPLSCAQVQQRTTI